MVLFERLCCPISRIGTRSLATLREKVPKIDPKSLYEPIIADTRPFPEYKQLNIRLKCVDYGPLESYQAYIHGITKKFGFEVEESYAVAAITENVVTYKRGTAIADSNIELSHYDRWIRICDIPAIRLPIFIQLLRAHAPVGIEIQIKEHTKEDEVYRYIPDLLLKELQEELKSLDNPIVRKNLGWE